MEKLPDMLWAYRTIKCNSTSETSFSLVYGMEAIIPVNIYMPTLHTNGIEWDQNVGQLCLAQDQSEERRQQAPIRIVAYQQQIKTAHHKKVKTHKFQVGDLLLKRVIQSTWKKILGSSDPTVRVLTLWLPKGQRFIQLSRSKWKNTWQTMKFFSFEVILCIKY